jgi:hypothetical protein
VNRIFKVRTGIKGKLSKDGDLTRHRIGSEDWPPSRQGSSRNSASCPVDAGATYHQNSVRIKRMRR